MIQPFITRNAEVCGAHGDNDSYRWSEAEPVEMSEGLDVKHAIRFRMFHTLAYLGDAFYTFRLSFTCS